MCRLNTVLTEAYRWRGFVLDMHLGEVRAASVDRAPGRREVFCGGLGQVRCERMNEHGLYAWSSGISLAYTLWITYLHFSRPHRDSLARLYRRLDHLQPRETRVSLAEVRFPVITRTQRLVTCIRYRGG